MSSDLLSILMPLAPSLITLGFFLFFFPQRTTFAEGICYAVVCMFISLSLIFQGCFIFNGLNSAVFFETALATGAIIAAWRYRNNLKITTTTIWIMLRSHPLAMGGLVMCVGYIVTSLGLHLLVVPDEPLYNARLWGSWDNPLAYYAAAGEAAALFPLNYPALLFQFSPFGDDGLSGFPGLWAYIAVGAGTYALSRRYAWPPTSITVTMMVLSMPRLITDITAAPLELCSAAAALFCLVSMYRVVERPRRMDLSFLVLGIAFTVSDGNVCLVLPSVLTGLGVILLYRRHGVATWKRLLFENRTVALITAVLWGILSQLWVFSLNLYHQRPWAGSFSQSALQFNTDGAAGSAANFVRYLFASTNLTHPIDFLCRWSLEFKLTDFLQFVYDGLVFGVFEDKGAAVPFKIIWDQDLQTIWFGPFGSLLLLPVLVYALANGPRRLKSTALMLCFYLYLISLILAWQPSNSALFTPFYACSGFCIAFFLPPWRIARTGRRAIQLVCLLSFCYGFFLLGNLEQPY